MSDLQRDKFEEWFFVEIDGSAYAENVAWQAWQAAIESVVVELPEYSANNHIRNIAIDECKASLDKSGIKYE